MEQINIRIGRATHRRLNLIKGLIGMAQPTGSAPTMDDVINAALDLLEEKVSGPNDPRLLVNVFAEER